MNKNKAGDKVTVRIERRDEVYNGRETGRFTYRVFSSSPLDAMGGVLGRGSSADTAIADFVFRAREDGHRIARDDLTYAAVEDRTRGCMVCGVSPGSCQVHS